jgi:hypothetical protein
VVQRGGTLIDHFQKRKRREASPAVYPDCTQAVITGAVGSYQEGSRGIRKDPTGLRKPGVAVSPEGGCHATMTLVEARHWSEAGGALRAYTLNRDSSSKRENPYG